MALSARQALALRRSLTATFNLWFGSVRSGKTIASLWAFLYQLLRHDGEGIVLIVGLNRNTVWRNIFVPLLTDPAFAAVAPHIHYREGAPSGTIYGRRFQVVGANDESSWLAIQGLTVAICLGDEVTGWPKSFWSMLESRLSLDTSWFLGTCNPGTSNHYLVEQVIDRAAKGDEDYHTELMLLRDNPFVSARVKARYHRTFSGVFAKRMLHGQWVAAEGAVYERWDADRMVCPLPVREDGETMAGTVLAVALDYGTQHPTVGHALTVGDDGRLYITHEWSPNPGSVRATDSELGDSFQEWLAALPNQPRFIYADPAAASFREELKRRGIVTNRADNAVVPGIRTVDSLLVAGDLLIVDTCTHLLGEIPGYRWDPKATAKGNDAPIKENDDACDSLRYVIRSTRHLWGRLVQSIPA